MRTLAAAAILLGMLAAPASAEPPPSRARLQGWRDRFESHLRGNLLAFWLKHDLDGARGGFHGALDRAGTPDLKADRSLVLNARLLWTFSAASRMFSDPAYRDAAKRAFDYLDKFRDRKHKGGYFWSVDAGGKVKDDHKYIYGQSFVVYGMIEYWLMSGEQNLQKRVFSIFHQFDLPAHDRVNGGYMESFKRDWQPELVIDPIGPPDQKSANTHLHLLESLTSLVRATGHRQVRERLAELRSLFISKMVAPGGYTREYFKPDWTPTKDESSYGHDVELAWLLPEATEALGLPGNDPDTLRISKALVDHALAFGFDRVRGGFFDRGPSNGMASDRSKNWWAQAEGLVGLLEVYKRTNDPAYFDAFERTAEFVFRDLVDPEYGEWYEGFKADGTLLNTNKASFWKCPYHNARACLEVIKRLDVLIARAK
ncbi:MAG: AGE family epimerase/isomerase [Candidatus Coatesbacteria bacterium]